MLHLNGFSAWITVDREPLPAYAVEIDQQQNLVTCWVASTLGKTFAVNWRDSNIVRPFASSGSVTVDGQKCGGSVLKPGAGESKKIKVDSVRASATTVRPLMFGALDLTDDDSHLDSDTLQHLGQIALNIHYVTIEGKRRWRSYPVIEAGVVHERSKKAVAHRVGLGEEVVRREHSKMIVKHLDTGPAATFIFKYRSIDTLMAMGIVPKATTSTAAVPIRQSKRTRDNAIKKEKGSKKQSRISKTEGDDDVLSLSD